jgi:hypothetical protein
MKNVICWVQFNNNPDHWADSEFFRLSPQNGYIGQNNIVVNNFRLTLTYG